MPDPSQSPFRRLWVVHDPAGVTRVEWEMTARFRDPRPHTFTLEAAPSSAPSAAAWAAVGLPAENAYFLTDDRKRDYGKTFDHFWRVRLDTPAGAYASPTVGPEDGLNFREWRLVREMLRQARKRTAKFTGVAGRLFKRRRYGSPCATCVDPHTAEPTRSDCPECYGTGVSVGYHAAVPGLFADLGLEQNREATDMQTATAKPVVVKATFYGYPPVNDRDVFAEDRSGRRWFVETVSDTAALRGYPIHTDVELRLAPFKDAVYLVPDDGV